MNEPIPILKVSHRFDFSGGAGVYWQQWSHKQSAGLFTGIPIIQMKNCLYRVT